MILKLAKFTGVRRNPYEYAGTGAIRQDKKPNRERLGFLLLVVGRQPASNHRGNYVVEALRCNANLCGFRGFGSRTRALLTHCVCPAIRGFLGQWSHADRWRDCHSLSSDGRSP